jgi:signal recognition particle subunit SRP54
MAFESLTDKLQGVFKKFTGTNRLSEKNMDQMLTEIKKALLEADVNINVVKAFIFDIRQQIIGTKVLSALNPSQMVIKLVNEELTKILGSNASSIQFNGNGLSSIMLLGLQGSGKTTQAAKLAKLLVTKYKRKVLLVACDVYRPAAIAQLQDLGTQIHVDVYTKDTKKVVDIIKGAKEYALNNNLDTLIVDTAGRLDIDEQLMEELSDLEKALKPSEELLVVDALVGQNAANVAGNFAKKLKLTGVILTKLDSDTRGGAALSIVSITKLPIKFSGVGEKIDDFELFYPDRMAQRILGMGDLLSLIEQAQTKMDDKNTQKATQRMMQGKFDFNDFLSQLEMVNKMGSIKNIIKMIPGMPKVSDEQIQAGQEKLQRVKVVIQSMTIKERKNPDLIKADRKIRIAKGCGKEVSEVNLVMKFYEQAKEMVKKMPQMAASGKLPFNS